jgi:hypothetical protein
VGAIKAAVERRPSLPLSTVRVSPFPCSPVIPCNSALSQPSREDSGNTSRPSTPLQRVKLRSVSRTPTPGSRQPAVAHAHAIHPKQPVQTLQQFYDRLALIDRSVAHSQEAHFRHHLLRVSEHLDTCDGLVGRIDQVDTEAASMLDKWKSAGKVCRTRAKSCWTSGCVSPHSLTHLSLTIVSSFYRINWWNCKRLSGRPWNTFRNWSMRRGCSITLASRSFSRQTFSIWLSVWTSASSFSNPMYEPFFCQRV